jgi:hypothetical protein
MWFAPGVFWIWMAISSVFRAMLFLAVPVAAIERRGIFASIGRSLSLSRSALPRVYALVLLLHIISWGSGHIVRYTAPDPLDHGGSYGTTFVVHTCVSFAFYLALASISMVINAVAYRSLRDAKEGPPAHELASVFE